MVRCCYVREGRWVIAVSWRVVGVCSSRPRRQYHAYKLFHVFGSYIGLPVSIVKCVRSACQREVWKSRVYLFFISACGGIRRVLSPPPKRFSASTGSPLSRVRSEFTRAGGQFCPAPSLFPLGPGALGAIGATPRSCEVPTGRAPGSPVFYGLGIIRTGQRGVRSPHW